jgi:hypothetical protein
MYSLPSSHALLTSFDRGFRRVFFHSLSRSALCFQHAKFKRDEPHLLRDMKLVPAKSTGNTTSDQIQQGPTERKAAGPSSAVSQVESLFSSVSAKGEHASGQSHEGALTEQVSAMDSGLLPSTARMFVAQGLAEAPRESHQTSEDHADPSLPQEMLQQTSLLTQAGSLGSREWELQRSLDHRRALINIGSQQGTSTNNSQSAPVSLLQPNNRLEALLARQHQQQNPLRQPSASLIQRMLGGNEAHTPSHGERQTSLSLPYLAAEPFSQNLSAAEASSRLSIADLDRLRMASGNSNRALLLQAAMNARGFDAEIAASQNPLQQQLERLVQRQQLLQRGFSATSTFQDQRRESSSSRSSPRTLADPQSPSLLLDLVAEYERTRSQQQQQQLRGNAGLPPSISDLVNTANDLRALQGSSSVALVAAANPPGAATLQALIALHGQQNSDNERRRLLQQQHQQQEVGLQRQQEEQQVALEAEALGRSYGNMLFLSLAMAQQRQHVAGGEETSESRIEDQEGMTCKRHRRW